VALVDALPPGLATNLQPEVKKEIAAPARALPVLPDLNLPAPEAQKKENEDVPHLPTPDEKGKAEDTAPPAALPTPSPEARVLLRRFAAAMAARPAGIRAGTWSPMKLGLTDLEGVLRLHEPFTGTSRP
jgi:hypothetical protein